MKLTRKQAIEKSIVLWEWLEKTGKEKYEYSFKRKPPLFECYLCSFGIGNDDEHCPLCPYYQHYQKRCTDKGTPFTKWQDAPTQEDKKKYAALFLEELKALREEK